MKEKQPSLTWEPLRSAWDNNWATIRTKVPGGWLVLVDYNQEGGSRGAAITFYPDPNHEWDGGSLS